MKKAWFITCAGSGIGAGTARAVLRAGDRVIAAGSNLEARLAELGRFEDLSRTTDGEMAKAA
jgi:NAD(P)-dependent dehydrogenase (short-subunit alcohol dehydrogenase family)